MGAYRFSLYFKFQAGLCVSIERGQLVVRLPFLSAHIDLTKHGSGVFVFGCDLSNKRREFVFLALLIFSFYGTNKAAQLLLPRFFDIAVGLPLSMYFIYKSGRWYISK